MSSGDYFSVVKKDFTAEVTVWDLSEEAILGEILSGTRQESEQPA